MSASPETTLHERPAEILQRLIRFDTTNPPGEERACVEWVESLTRDLPGVQTTLVAKDPDRPTLIARLAGRGEAPPLLMQGHIDVVPALGDWTHPPFGGDIVDGYVWGRGALDMKGGVAMMIAAFLAAAVADTPPPGDVLLCVLSDEEAGGEYGAQYLVDERPELLEGVRFAIGEFGGFSMDLGGTRIYPLMVGEKQICNLRATLRGPAGHGSLPVRGGAMGRLGGLLAAIDRQRLPVHVTPVPRMTIEAIADALPKRAGVPIRLLLRPRMTDRVLDALGDRASFLDPLLHNTVSPTVVRGGHAPNVIPGEVSVDLDCRLLPGFGPEDVMRELRELSGVDIDFEVLRFQPGPPAPDMGLYDVLAGILSDLDPSGTPVPLLMPATSDGRHFAKLGIQTYGFLPMQLPADLRFMELIHAENERLNVASMDFGARAIGKLLERFDQTR
jgi:acetylornithine deacetylase/succinyl-diaminopimelate desuccinylase-like protein